jgi:hypothetical protein
MRQPRACDSGNKIAASAHGMGSGGSAVDAMAIGCLGVERRAERFFSYLAITEVLGHFSRFLDLLRTNHTPHQIDRKTTRLQGVIFSIAVD